MRRWWFVRPSSAVPVPVAAALALLAVGCPPPPEPPDPGPVEPPVISTQQNEELAAAKARIVPYDVEQGTTVYAIRDLLQAAARLPNVRDRGEAQFLAAAATLDLVLYADLAADDRPIAGLRDAWEAEGRDGVVAAVDAFLEGMAGSFLPSAEQNARLVAAALRSRDHAAADVAALNGIADAAEPLSFAARVLLLDAHSRLLDRTAVEGSNGLLAEAAALSAVLPDPAGDAFAALDENAQAAARLLAFAAANAGAVREAAAFEPLAALIGAWIEARRLDERTLSFVRPLGAAELPSAGASLARVPFAGRAPAARLYVAVDVREVLVGLSDEVRISGGAVELVRAALGAEGAATATCAVPDPLPAPPRRWTCLQNVLAAAGSAGASGRVLVASAGNVTLPLVTAVLQEAGRNGFTEVEAAGIDSGGALGVFPLAYSEDRTLVSAVATVRIAQGGFYVGRRGDLMQVPRVSGAYDFAGLTATVRGREPPVVVVPAEGTPWSTVLAAVSAVADLAADAGAVVQFLSGGL